MTFADVLLCTIRQMFTMTSGSTGALSTKLSARSFWKTTIPTIHSGLPVLGQCWGDMHILFAILSAISNGCHRATLLLKGHRGDTKG